MLAPFGSINEAIEYAGNDAIIALSKGTFDEVVELPTGVVSCDPFGEGGQLDCDYLGVEYAHFLGEEGCTPIGTECPEGLWATNLPSIGKIIYVKAGAPEGGDGSETSPFGSINQAIDSAGSSAVIALSKGTFYESESVALRSGITLWGACVRETIIEGISPIEEDAVITVRASNHSDIEVRNLQITGQQIGVWVGGRRVSFHVEDDVIRQTAILGIYVKQGQTTIRNVVVRDTQSRQSDDMWGIGLNIALGAEVEVIRSIIKNNRKVGVFAEGAGTKIYFDAFENIFWWNNTNNTTGDALIVPEAGHIDVSFHLGID